MQADSLSVYKGPKENLLYNGDFQEFLPDRSMGMGWIKYQSEGTTGNFQVIYRRESRIFGHKPIKAGY